MTIYIKFEKIIKMRILTHPFNPIMELWTDFYNPATRGRSEVSSEFKQMLS